MSELRYMKTTAETLDDRFCMALTVVGCRAESILAELPDLEVLSGKRDGQTMSDSIVNLGLVKGVDRDDRELSRPPLKWGINE